jgi:uncharacterized protein
MNANVGIAIFVKTPGISPIKTRLAAQTGETYAREWYHFAALACKAVAEQTRAQVYWAVAEASCLEHPCWQSLPCIAQCQFDVSENNHTDLGARMQRVHATLLQQHTGGILVGADAPHMELAQLQLAIDWLCSSAPRQAIGPACDGGFWLYGGNRLSALNAWQSVTYSQANTREDFCLALADAGEWQHLAELADVDTAADLLTCRSALETSPHALLSAQRALLDWMQST